MASAVTKSTLVSSIWQNFRDRLYSDVGGTSVTITGSTSITLTATKITSTFPDKFIDLKSSYPVLVVEPPVIDTEKFTLGKSQVNGTIAISLYTAQAESADKFADAILDSIETYKGEFADNGIHSINLRSLDSDSAQRESIKVHLRTFTFEFIVRYAKTGAY